MSTELKTLQGKIEVPNLDDRTSEYNDTNVFVTSFYGGKDRGQSLQITFLDESGNYTHVQLDNENVKALVKELKYTFGL